MKQFLQLIRVARESGIDIGNYSKYQPGERVNYEPSTPDNLFWTWIEKCRPFVFGERPQNVNGYLPVDWNRPIAAAPFEVFSLECLSGPIVEYESHGTKIVVNCILVIEVEPNKFACVSLATGTNGIQRVFTTQSLKDIVDVCLAKMEDSTIGAETCRQTIKLGSGKNKRIHRIRQVIHVANKKTVQELTTSHRNIDWSHRFEVRGHWRDLPGGLGKDREGNYCVKDHTWVTHYTKGPENLPLVKKTRLVNLSHENHQP